jgi:hypothetical protein
VLARKEEYRRRYIVARSVAWLGHFRRLVLRWERLFSVSRSGCACAVMRLCMRRASALACPIPLGVRRARSVDAVGGRGAIGAPTREPDRLRAAVAS